MATGASWLVWQPWLAILAVGCQTYFIWVGRLSVGQPYLHSTSMSNKLRSPASERLMRRNGFFRSGRAGPDWEWRSQLAARAEGTKA